MEFYEFGHENNKKLLLIHGMMTTWKMSYDSFIQYASKQYQIIVVALDGHNPVEESTFESLRKEADTIENYLERNFNGRIFAVYGSSLGGTIVLHLLANQKVMIEKAILDGTYAIDYGVFAKSATKIMTAITKKIVNGESKLMNKMMGIENKDSISELMYTGVSKESLMNCYQESYSFHLPEYLGKTKTDVEFWFGSKEKFPPQLAKKIKKQLPKLKIKVFERCGHGDLLRNVEKLMEELNNSL